MLGIQEKGFLSKRKIPQILTDLIKTKPNSNHKTQQIQKKLEEFGVTIHSIDEVAAGKRIVEAVMTLQDSSARM